MLVRGRAPLTLFAVGLLTVACGSTVQTRSSLPTSNHPAYDGLAPAGTRAPGGGALIPKDGVSGGVGGAPGSPGAAQSSGSPARGPVPGSEPLSPVRSGQDGPGVTATTISIGLAYPRNADKAQAAFGNSAVTSGDVGSMMRILVNQVNKEGGVAGRRLVPVEWSYDAATKGGKTEAQLEQEACAAFTQDHHVFAAFPADGVLECLHRHGSIGLKASGLIADTTAQLDRYPEMVDIGGLAIDRLARNLAPLLSRARYFTPWDPARGEPGVTPAEVAILAPDRPQFRRGVSVLQQALRGVGVDVEPQNVAYFYWPKSQAESGQTVTDIQSYTLKFQSNRVTHVIPLEQNGLVFFSSAADKQSYRPRYGLNSQTSAQAFNGSLLTASQLRGSLGLGIFPATDLTASDNPDDGPYSNPSRRACVKLLRANGVSFANPAEQAVGVAVCDAFWTLRRVLDSVPKTLPLNQATVVSAIDRIGSLPSGSLTSVTYGPHRRDAVSGGWVWRFVESCSCMRYDGARFTLS